MGIFDKLWGRRPAPPPPPPLPVPPLSPRLVSVPVKVQPLPVFPADPLTAEVARLWTDFQRTHANPSWSQFVTALATANADLAARIAKTERDLASYPPGLIR